MTITTPLPAAILLAALLATTPARAETLAPIDEAGLAAARAHLATTPQRAASIQRDASWLLLRGRERVGSLVALRGPVPDRASSPRPCHLLLLRPGAPAALLPTIGEGEWEAETCLGLEAVGMLPPDGATPRIGLIYRAASPNAEPREPLVLRLDPATPRLDIEASRRASEAGATTIAAMRRLPAR